jgi:hypothetical protein
MSFKKQTKKTNKKQINKNKKTNKQKQKTKKRTHPHTRTRTRPHTRTRTKRQIGGDQVILNNDIKHQFINKFLKSDIFSKLLNTRTKLHDILSIIIPNTIKLNTETNQLILDSEFVRNLMSNLYKKLPDLIVFFKINFMGVAALAKKILEKKIGQATNPNEKLLQFFEKVKIKVKTDEDNNITEIESIEYDERSPPENQPSPGLTGLTLPTTSTWDELGQTMRQSNSQLSPKSSPSSKTSPPSQLFPEIRQPGSTLRDRLKHLFVTADVANKTTAMLQRLE